MNELEGLTCTACRGDEPLLTTGQIDEYRPQVPYWEVLKDEGMDKLKRSFRFRNFAEALAFTNRIGEIAEGEGHHPTLETSWGRVVVWWWTHKIKGLHRNDFIMARKTDVIYQEAKGAT